MREAFLCDSERLCELPSPCVLSAAHGPVCSSSWTLWGGLSGFNTVEYTYGHLYILSDLHCFYSLFYTLIMIWYIMSPEEKDFSLLVSCIDVGFESVSFGPL